MTNEGKFMTPERSLESYISCVKEIVRAIKYVADANSCASILVLAQRVLIDLDTIDAIIEKITQNRKEN